MNVRQRRIPPEEDEPLVGDNVSIDIIDEEEKKGNVVEILPRKNALIRPAVANVDQALVIFAGTSPKPNLNLLDRFFTDDGTAGSTDADLF